MKKKSNPLSNNRLKENEVKKKPLFFRIIRFCIHIFYRKRTFYGMENLTDEPTIVVGNHAQIHGPLTVELFFPTKKYAWCIGQVMKTDEFPSYAMEDFWARKPKRSKCFFKICAYVGAPLATFVFRNSDTIAVYHDTRGIGTYRETMQRLEENAKIIIFPEKSEPYNDIVNEFQDKFIDVARLYYGKYKKVISFVPMYTAARLKKVVFGTPIKYDPLIPIDKQRKIISEHIKSEITRLAKELPKHKIVPYDNVGRKKYIYSK